MHPGFLTSFFQHLNRFVGHQHLRGFVAQELCHPACASTRIKQDATDRHIHQCYQFFMNSRWNKAFVKRSELAEMVNSGLQKIRFRGSLAGVPFHFHSFSCSG